MFRNYIITAVRNLQRNQVFAFLNIIGLAMGIGCATVVFRFISHEKSYDKFHSNYDKIWRVVNVEDYPDGIEYGMGTPHPTGPALMEDYPELEVVARVNYVYGDQINIDKGAGNISKHLLEEGIAFVDNEFFEIFDVKWIAGDPSSALKNPNEVVLSVKTVERLYDLNRENASSAIGLTLNYGNRKDFVVVGVVEDQPENTNFPFLFYFAYDGQDGINPYFGEGKRWNSTSSNTNTYFIAPEGFSKVQFDEQLVDFVKKYRPGDQTLSYVVQPFSEIHFDERFGSYVGTTDRKVFIAFSLIGLFLIITACINFINLATAQATKRAKEIGIRKAIGGLSYQLIIQFLSEIAIITLFALLLSLAFSELIFIYLEDIIEVRLQLNLLTDFTTVLFLIVTFLVVTLLSGLYPSIILSRMNAIQAIKSKISAKTHSGGITLRKGLVVMQFAISQCLIISTFIIAKQMDFFQSKDLGFEKNAIVSTYLPEQDQVKMDRFRQKMISNNAISDVTYGLSTPTGNSDSHSNFNYAPLQSEVDYQGNFKAIDEGYEEFFNIPLLAGRFLQRGDSMNVVINRKIADLMGFGDDVSKAVGETLETGWGGDKKVVGVVENFHAYRLSESLDYVFFIHYTDAFYNLSFKINSEENTQNALAHFRKTWEEVYPEYAIDYTFFDEIIENQYRREAAYSRVLQLFSLISIIIGCLGLYGLISFIANNRIKEIGIRKVLGASVYSILRMFSTEIITLVIVAFIIATPISYYLLSEWLSTYVFRINIGFGIFLTAFLVTLLIAIITISHRTISSARVNPAATLKDE